MLDDCSVCLAMEVKTYGLRRRGGGESSRAKDG